MTNNEWTPQRAVRRETQVLVIGAGPVGLFTALCLARRGIEFEVVDARPHESSQGDAVLLHAQTLRTMVELGLTDSLLSGGHQLDHLVVYDGARRAVDVPLREVISGALLALPQQVLAAALARLLERAGRPVLWRHRVGDVSVRADGVDVEVREMRRVPSSSPAVGADWMPCAPQTWRSAFIVGADGYHSRVRESLGIPYERFGPLEAFAIYDFDLRLEAPHEMRVVLQQGTPSALVPLGRARGRWMFQLREMLDEQPDSRSLQKLLSSRAPWFQPAPDAVSWATVTHFERRLAACFGRGRIWLAGDAAHLSSPISGDSLNRGLLEGCELARRLGDVLSGRATLGSLEEYGVESRREWLRLLGADGKASSRAAPTYWLHGREGELLTLLPATGPELDELLERMGVSPA